jgi:2-polyprenyl-3-methyl-5-hydroxy-6-metoxy-1,4-benzoquinol methylase
MHKRLFASRSVVRCDACGLVQVHPVPTPEELSYFYDKEYRTSGFNACRNEELFPYESLTRLSRGRSIRELVARHVSLDGERKVLELGAGLGHNLLAFKEKYPGCELVANEGDPSCCRCLDKLEARNVAGYWGDPAVRETIAKLGPFDVVILAHVLEHPDRPREFLSWIAPVLAENGVVVAEVPNDPIEWVKVSKHSPHVSFFDRKTLGELLSRCGADVRFLDTCGPVKPVDTQRSLAKRLVPESLKRWIWQKTKGQQQKRALNAEEIRDVDVLPARAYGEYGGDSRTWIRTIFSVNH